MNKLIVNFILLTAIAPSARSAPQLYSQCPEERLIKHPAGAQGLYMSGDCKVAYVLPPESAQMQLAGLASDLDPALCKSVISDVQRFVQEGESLDEHDKELQRVERKLRQRHGHLVDLEERCEASKKSENAAKRNNERAKDDVARLEAKLADLDVEKAACETSEADRSCSEINQEIQYLKEDLRDHKEILAEKEAAAKEKARRSADCEAERASEEERILAADKALAVEKDALSAKRDQVRASRERTFSKINTNPGALLNIAYTSGAMPLIEKYQELNRSRVNGVVFKPINIASGALAFSQVTNGKEADIPVFQKVNMLGFKVNGENGTLETVLFDANGDPMSNESIAYVSAASGQAVINAYSSCVALASSLSGDAHAAVQKIARAIAGSVVFRFSVQVKRTIKILYNEKHLYRLIRHNRTRGGLFRTSSSASLTEKSLGQQWLTIDINSEDPEHEFEKSEEYLMDLRREYLDSALMRVAKGYLSTAQAEAREPGENSAGKTSEGLRKCPHLYCQYAAIAVDVGNALFGGTDQSASTEKDHEAWSIHNLTDKKAIFRSVNQNLVMGAK